MSSRLLIDVHNHVYLPRYASLLRSRSNAPRILSRLAVSGGTEERLLILDHEPSGGRPVGPQYWDRSEKLKFMDLHGIDISIVSSANPWLDFLSASSAVDMAKSLNEDLEEYCQTSPTVSLSLKRLYGFGLLPLVPSVSSNSLVQIVDQISSLPHLKGVIMGTRGIGKGLDDEALNPMWEAIERKGLVIFLHPHYGVGKEEWGEKENGHVLPLALGFPMETTIAVTRLILAGVLDRYPNLRLLLAHSGGALPQLSSRLASCIHHDPVVASRLKHDARYYLGKLWFDAVAYGSEELEFVGKVVSRATRYKSASAPTETDVPQSNKLLFGTDYPFFPPLEAQNEKWRSVLDNLEAINGVESWTQDEKDNALYQNAIDLFGLNQSKA
ncbi:amidohydrolase 2 [Sistotremastrum suecicum HHB10207 ss-3]|uniref:Amidohydrolase 2 n=1 Tax=Sistotremastrum suecicum HHB10207 ss-3 TaxID=1314776 RepID=A0A166EIV8_9AGAM|nr:amidohydrolase 2 [Sistotremastrum suecicum HHB10207 ss-3]